jgi:hypothetical protein
MIAEERLFLVKLILEAEDSIIDELDEITDLRTVVKALKESRKEHAADSSECSSESSSESSPDRIEDSRIEDSRIEEDNGDDKWEELKMNHNYEINTAYPFRVRKKGCKRLIKEFNRHDSYVGLMLGNKIFYKHILVARQWIPNPNNYTEIDHINRHPSDNHLSNLRWVTRSQNLLNRGGFKGHKYEYVDELPDGSIEVKRCNGWQFTGLFYHEGTFFSKVGDVYRKLLQLNHAGSKRVYVRDSEGKHRALQMSIFNRELKCGTIGK